MSRRLTKRLSVREALEIIFEHDEEGTEVEPEIEEDVSEVEDNTELNPDFEETDQSTDEEGEAPEEQAPEETFQSKSGDLLWSSSPQDKGKMQHFGLVDDCKLQDWSVIGSGGFGQIYKAKHEDLGMEVAIKLLHYDDGSSASLLKEAEFMRQGGSPYVVRVFGVYQGVPPGRVLSSQMGLVMELMERGSVESLLKRLGGPPPWPLAFRLAHQVALGMNFLHQLCPPLLHLDLKPSNVLLDHGFGTKITDFGLARLMRSISSVGGWGEGRGTLSYMPPEAFQTPYKATPASDSYSYAILLWSIITGREPYGDAVLGRIQSRVPEGYRPSLEGVNRVAVEGLGEIIDLMERCWDPSPQKRPSFHDCLPVAEKVFELQNRGIHDAIHQVSKALALSDSISKTSSTTGVTVDPRGGWNSIDWTPPNFRAADSGVGTEPCPASATSKALSDSISKTSSTRTSLEELLSDLGLEHHLKNKLTLSQVLQIDGETLSDESIQSQKALPWCFLRKLMMVNVTARSVRCTSKQDRALKDWERSLDTQYNPQLNSNRVNPMDLITAVFLCSDGFLQQEMVLKMSMCQFSVPLLLPTCDEQECTFMLWAMRDIVKKYKPHSLANPRGFVEESIVLSDLPMVSFVRLGNSSMSKSHTLNQVLSNPQQYHDTFVHKNMECGDTPRRISNGLVEISWYLPRGKRDTDIFSEPLAVANLRGDLRDFKTQYAFLCSTSAAIFVFCDDFGSECKILDSKHTQAHWFLISNSQSKSFNKNEFRRCVSEFQLRPRNIIIKGPQMNNAEFVNKLHSAISDILKGNVVKMSVEGISAVSHEFGIHVDEDYTYCKRGKEKADEITGGISDIPSFKEKELPLQGTAWKQLANLQREECRMKNAGEKNIEIYRNELSDLMKKLRAQQRAHNISEFMSRFISAMSSPTEERKYFLKWMRINLDNLSRKALPLLQAQYKEQCQNSSENKEVIAELDRKISSCSLGTEHFLREMGQLYESACSLPEGPTSQIQRLPRLAAELLQEGFPLELVDGDASNIPLQWVTQVLNELHHLTQDKCKICVFTVLGVQGTGKSTLLSTMFGVQFAVSSGRCTRGAFMLLIRVKEDFKSQLGCDYMMVIDTEGLKSPELAQLDDSYEHDNELATLVVGLSDITVINIAMENCTEMKDILQIVVHAFLRMKEVGRKPCCLFVHQNVPDISAHDKNMRHRKLLLEQLNEMTQAAVKMEKKGTKKTFTDIMEYHPERNTSYIPGLWHGNPPMAPVNAGYSESVNCFKRSVIEKFMEQTSGKCSAHTINSFLEWTRSLWKAVKYENFIFSFRNSFVAEAYAQLCTEFNNWEWDFRKNMYSWLVDAETKVSNFGTEAAQTQPPSNIDNLLIHLKSEASVKLTEGEQHILDNLTEFYKRPDGHVQLVEKYKEDFISTAKTIRMETENSVKNKLEAAVEIRKGIFKFEDIHKNHMATMEQKVLDLIEKCRKSEEPSDQQLEDEFEKMLNETVAELQFSGLEERDIVQDISNQLWVNLERNGSAVREILSQVGNLHECGREGFEVKGKDGLWQKIRDKLIEDQLMEKTQGMADHIIKDSKQFVDEKMKTKSDYHNTYITELLCRVDRNLDRYSDLETNAEFEVKLKIYICGDAARAFKQMHLDFIRANDPRRCLEQFKEQCLTDFKDLFSKRDQCQKKAEEFTYNCLAPAVTEYITKSLGPDLVDEVLTGQKAIDFSTRSFFQFSILKQLLSGDNFKDFVKYIKHYKTFVQDWILEQMVKQFTEGDGLRSIEIKHLKAKVKRIKEAIMNAQMEASKRPVGRGKEAGRGEEAQNIQQLIQDICSDLQELVIPKEPRRAVLALNTAKPEDFSRCLEVLVDEMEQAFTAEFQKGGDVRARLTSLPFQPQKELFKRVFGCGRQCPFCRAPCEAGGKNHTEHFASIHRPQGIGRYRNEDSMKLVCDICSTNVASETKFKSPETEWKLHPCKEYQSIYPDWRIQPDTSIQASDYWKYIFTRFNKQFAQEYKAEPADIPPQWRDITQDQAMENLEESFKMKTGD
ncbi:interferon-induced very large GTPase 1-like [Conger conger]|uniref:interferon-induced very large GTPase 1-like n=1 Tax=Conger conger TaxID=82655 RepID=UPI002A598FE5|nr:interferon-induced very large GTPase 1-like [Conger conger]